MGPRPSFYFGVHEGVHLPVTGRWSRSASAIISQSFMQVASLSFLNEDWI